MPVIVPLQLTNPSISIDLEKLHSAFTAYPQDKPISFLEEVLHQLQSPQNKPISIELIITKVMQQNSPASAPAANNNIHAVLKDYLNAAKKYQALVVAEEMVTTSTGVMLRRLNFSKIDDWIPEIKSDTEETESEEHSEDEEMVYAEESSPELATTPKKPTFLSRLKQEWRLGAEYIQRYKADCETKFAEIENYFNLPEDQQTDNKNQYYKRERAHWSIIDRRLQQARREMPTIEKVHDKTLFNALQFIYPLILSPESVKSVHELDPLTLEVFQKSREQVNRYLEEIAQEEQKSPYINPYRKYAVLGSLHFILGNYRKARDYFQEMTGKGKGEIYGKCMHFLRELNEMLKENEHDAEMTTMTTP